MNNTIKRWLRTTNKWVVAAQGKSPPRQIPPPLVAQYTLDGQIPIVFDYACSVKCFSLPTVRFPSQIRKMMKKAESHQSDHYPETDPLLFQALEKYPCSGKNCAVLGSINPYYECVCLAHGAMHVTTIEYNRLFYFHPKIQTQTVTEYDSNPETFDVVLSISSFEHDGLGRYGDPLHPSADLSAMHRTRSMLKANGLLFLSVPIGKDCLVWNKNRTYGNVRLPELLKGWTVIDTFGFEKEMLESPVQRQPVFVLSPNH